MKGYLLSLSESGHTEVYCAKSLLAIALPASRLPEWLAGCIEDADLSANTLRVKVGP